MSALSTFSFNGKSVEDYGLVPIQGTKSWFSVPKRTFKTSPLAMRDGARALSSASTSDPRALAFSLRIEPTSMADRRAKVNAIVSDLAGLVTVVSVDDPTKACYGLLLSADPSFPYGPALGTLKGEVDAALTCFDPLWYDIVPQSVAITAVNTRFAIAQGSAQMRKLQIWCFGAFTSPLTLKIRNAAGDVIATMAIAVTCTSAEYLVIDFDAFSITKYSGGVASDVTGNLSIGQDFYGPSPSDAPTVEMDKGTGMVYALRPWVA